MKPFSFTVDDNIIFLRDVTSDRPASLFDHPYMAMMRRLHERFNLKIQLNLFYESEGFTLADMTDAYRAEWEANADWLKLSFHSRLENVRPYEASDYREVYDDCRDVHREILRFAGESSLAVTTTVHYCATTKEGTRALADHGMRGLLGLFGTDEAPRTSYALPESLGAMARRGAVVRDGGVAFAELDLVVNCFGMDALPPRLAALLSRDALHIMIHEQYFYPDYRAYQPDFEEKLSYVFDTLITNGFESRFFEEMI